MSATQIKTVTAADTWALRHRVLRPHLPVESAQYPEDTTREAIHVAAVRDGAVVGVASAYREAENGVVDERVWRLRGMATAPEVRGTGLGGQILAAIINEVQALGGSRIWCNARKSASGFYEHFGFAVEGGEYEMPGIGPHYLMKKPL